jgi:pimeloyl-ACP methyl ester carboxylesterase
MLSAAIARESMNVANSAGTERLNQQYTLRDGRRLGFAQYGDLAGTPVFYFHGWPSSRLEARVATELSARLRLRLIAPDRPGYGLSDFSPDRSISQWADDVADLASALGLERFAVLGISGGGPYAAVCAAALLGRINVALLVCSLSPLDAPGATDGMVSVNRWLLSMARNTPWLAQKLAASLLRSIWGNGDQVIPEQIASQLAAPDKQTLKDQRLCDALIASSKEGLRPGMQGAAWDGFLFARPWGFRLEDIRVPVHLWYAGRDVIVPPTMGQHLARAIPNCQVKFYPEDGHFSLPFGRMDEILQTVNRHPALA